MDVIREIFGLLFGQDPELRQIIGVTLRMSTLSTLISALFDGGKSRDSDVIDSTVGPADCHLTTSD